MSDSTTQEQLDHFNEIPQSSSTSNNYKLNVKLIRWSEYEHETPILLQDINGPCPLIALVNTLLLKYELKLRNQNLNIDQVDEETSIYIRQSKKFESMANLKKLLLNHVNGFIDLDKILSQLGDLLLIFNETNIDDETDDLSLDVLLESLPLLHTGLSVNPNLITGDFSSSDLSTRLFKKFDLIFKHGWCIDHVQSEASTFIPNKSTGLFETLQTFDQIQDLLLNEDEDTKDDRLILSEWLQNNKTQLTKIGLSKLNDELQKDDFIIFFRNNHFNTLYKRKDNEFYLLITDCSFNFKSSKKQVVWQSLISVSGSDDLFFTGDFTPILGDSLDDDSSSFNVDHIDRSNVSDSDYLLIKQLQEEEDQAMAKQLQNQFMSDSKRINKHKSKDKPSLTSSLPKNNGTKLLNEKSNIKSTSNLPTSTSNERTNSNSSEKTKTWKSKNQSQSILTAKDDKKKSNCIIS